MQTLTAKLKNNTCVMSYLISDANLEVYCLNGNVLRIKHGGLGVKRDALFNEV